MRNLTEKCLVGLITIFACPVVVIAGLLTLMIVVPFGIVTDCLSAVRRCLEG